MHGDLKRRIGTVDALLEERLHLRGTLSAKVRAARGIIPKHALARAREVADAGERLNNPATARTLDPRHVEASCAALEGYLYDVPAGKFRRRFWSSLFGIMALRLLFVVALLIAVLVWRGFI